MPIHPDVAARFSLLEGYGSMGELSDTAAGREQLRLFEAWPTAAAPPTGVREEVAPGPHGPVPVRVYETVTAAGGPRPCLVWLHGGGFIGGDLDMAEADRTAREVCTRAGAVVVSVGYRLALSGVHFPVPHDDVVAAVAWVRDRADDLGVDGSRITVGGASAGGNLAAGAVLALRDRDSWLPSVLVLVYPALHPVLPPPSASLAAALAELPPVFDYRPGDHAELVGAYLGGPPSSASGYAMPPLGVVDGLCPTVVVNAEYDRLRASGEAFTAALAHAGVDVRQVMVRGMLHGFLNLPAELRPVGRCLDLLAGTAAGTADLAGPCSPDPR